MCSITRPVVEHMFGYHDERSFDRQKCRSALLALVQERLRNGKGGLQLALRIQRPEHGPDALVYPFPAGVARRRSARAEMLARRRRTLGGLGALGIAASLWLAAPDSTQSQLARRASPATVVVRSGDTVWDLADRYGAPEADRRVYVDALVRLNDLEGDLQAGTRVRLPE
jgi:LysM domain